MEIGKSVHGAVTIVEVQGVINFGESARQFSPYLQNLLDAGVPAVLVDMSGIDNVDSTGLGELVGYLQRFENEGPAPRTSPSPSADHQSAPADPSRRDLSHFRGSGRSGRRPQPVISCLQPKGSSLSPVWIPSSSS